VKLRWIDDNGEKKLQLVNGERRTRCAKKLVKEKADCFDPITGETVKANELYHEIDAYISEMDDQTAYKHAFSSNDRAVAIGDGCTVALIREFRTVRGYTDQDIMLITGKSITWVKETDDLLGLDEKTFNALATDQINRSVAIDLSKIEDVAERMALLDTARNFAAVRLSNVKKKLETEVNSSEKKADLAKAKAVVADHYGDEEGKEEAEANVEKLKAKAHSKRKEKEEIESEAAKITSKDLQKAKNAKQKEAGGEERVALTKAKMKKYWYDVSVALIKSDGCDENGEPIEGIDQEDNRLGKLIMEQIAKGETDWVKILKHHQKAKEKRAG